MNLVPGHPELGTKGCPSKYFFFPIKATTQPILFVQTFCFLLFETCTLYICLYNMICFIFLLQILVTSNNGSNSKMYSIDDPWATKTIIRLQSLLLLQKSPMVKVAAFNSLGTGPFSESIPIVFDPLKDPLYYNEHFESGGSTLGGVGAQYTWLIALLGM